MDEKPRRRDVLAEHREEWAKLVRQAERQRAVARFNVALSREIQLETFLQRRRADGSPPIC
jgi:hypothetical protein